MEDFLAFRKMITPFIIKLLFILGVVVCVLVGLALIPKGGFASLVGLLYVFVGPIVWRVYCEIIIILFSINGTLTDIRAALIEKEKSS